MGAAPREASSGARGLGERIVALCCLSPSRARRPHRRVEENRHEDKEASDRKDGEPAGPSSPTRQRAATSVAKSSDKEQGDVPERKLGAASSSTSRSRNSHGHRAAQQQEMDTVLVDEAMIDELMTELSAKHPHTPCKANPASPSRTLHLSSSDTRRRNPQLNLRVLLSPSTRGLPASPWSDAGVAESSPGPGQAEKPTPKVGLVRRLTNRRLRLVNAKAASMRAILPHVDDLEPTGTTPKSTLQGDRALRERPADEEVALEAWHGVHRLHMAVECRQRAVEANARVSEFKLRLMNAVAAAVDLRMNPRGLLPPKWHRAVDMAELARSVEAVQDAASRGPPSEIHVAEAPSGPVGSHHRSVDEASEGKQSLLSTNATEVHAATAAGPSHGPTAPAPLPFLHPHDSTPARPRVPHMGVGLALAREAVQVELRMLPSLVAEMRRVRAALMVVHNALAMAARARDAIRIGSTGLVPWAEAGLRGLDEAEVDVRARRALGAAKVTELWAEAQGLADELDALERRWALTPPPAPAQRRMRPRRATHACDGDFRGFTPTLRPTDAAAGTSGAPVTPSHATATGQARRERAASLALHVLDDQRTGAALVAQRSVARALFERAVPRGGSSGVQRERQSSQVDVLAEGVRQESLERQRAGRDAETRTGAGAVAGDTSKDATKSPERGRWSRMLSLYERGARWRGALLGPLGARRLRVPRGAAARLRVAVRARRPSSVSEGEVSVGLTPTDAETPGHFEGIAGSAGLQTPGSSMLGSSMPWATSPSLFGAGTGTWPVRVPAYDPVDLLPVAAEDGRDDGSPLRYTAEAGVPQRALPPEASPFRPSMAPSEGDAALDDGNSRGEEWEGDGIHERLVSAVSGGEGAAIVDGGDGVLHPAAAQHTGPGKVVEVAGGWLAAGMHAGARSPRPDA